jgi:hypothetical protein
MNLLITDIDGTLALDGWRANIQDFDERQRAANEDKPNTVMIALLAGLAEGGWSVVALTSRNERWRLQTNKWLGKQDVACDDMYMRKNDDFSGAAEFKVQAVKRLLAQMAPAHVLLIDSREDVVAAYKAEGWSTLQS